MLSLNTEQRLQMSVFGQNSASALDAHTCAVTILGTTEACCVIAEAVAYHAAVVPAPAAPSEPAPSSPCLLP